MALVQLADIVQPDFFANYMAENSPVSFALSTSGVVVPNSLMQSQLTQGGDTLNIPMWSDLLSPADPGGLVGDNVVRIVLVFRSVNSI